jgi:hypothetical protein
MSASGRKAVVQRLSPASMKRAKFVGRTAHVIFVKCSLREQMRGLATSCQAFAMVLLAGRATQLAPTFGGRALALGASAGRAVHCRFRLEARHNPTLRTDG